MNLVIFYTKKVIKAKGILTINKFDAVDKLSIFMVCADSINKPISQFDNRRISGKN